MKNLTINETIAQSVLTPEEFMILKTLYQKVKIAEFNQQQTQQAPKNKMESVLSELENALNSTTEDITPELFEYLLASILKKHQVDATFIKMSSFAPEDLFGIPTQNVSPLDQKELEKILTSLLNLTNFKF